MEHDGYAERPTVAQLRAADAAVILADRGYDDIEHPAPHVYRRLVEKLAGGFLILDSIEAFIGTEPISGKGRAKRAMGLYLSVLDRVVRLAGLVGIDRVARPVNESPAEWLARVADERRRAEQQAVPAEQQATDPIDAPTDRH